MSARQFGWMAATSVSLLMVAPSSSKVSSAAVNPAVKGNGNFFGRPIGRGKSHPVADRSAGRDAYTIRTLSAFRMLSVGSADFFLSEDIGSALKGGVKVCQRQLVNEALVFVTELALNLGREGATPVHRGFHRRF